MKDKAFIILQYIYFYANADEILLQVVLLGSAPDPRIQNDFVNMANHLHSSHHDRARLCLTYDEPLSHLVSSCGTFSIYHLRCIVIISLQLMQFKFWASLDIRRSRFYCGPFNIWTMWTNSTHCHEIRVNTYCS